MTPGQEKIKRAARWAVTGAAYVAGIVLVLLMLGTVADVTGRYFFNRPILGVFDLTHFAVVIMVFLGVGYCAYYGSHAAIDLFASRFHPVIARFIQRVVDLAGGVLLLVIAWQSALAGIQIQGFGQSSQLLLIPVFPLYWVVVFGCILFAAILFLHALWPDLKETQSEEL